jgi:hypothetical protein
MKPDPKLIDSMALRYRHDFAFLDEQTQNSIRTTMTQLWEEVAGEGFYKLPQQEISDEEMKKAAANLANPNADKTDNFIEGAKWYREQLKQKK